MINNNKYFPFLYLVFLVLILPIVYYKNALDPVLLPRTLALSLILFILLLVMIYKYVSRRNSLSFGVLRNPLFYIFVAYILLSIISLLAATNLSEGIFDISKAILGLAVIVTASLIFSNYSNARLLLTKFMIICGIMLAIIGISQYFEVAFGWFLSHGIPSGTSVNRNIFLALLAIILPYSIYGSLFLSRVWKVLSILGASATIFLIIVGSTRAVWVAAFIASLICLAVYLTLIRQRKASPQESSKGTRSRLPVLAASVIIIFAISAGLLVTSKAGKGVFSRAASVFDRDLPSNYTRLDLWNKSLSMFEDHPFIGVGPGNWKINLASYGPVGGPRLAQVRFFQRPHNDYLWVLAEKGIFGLIAYLGIFAIVILYAVRTISIAPQHKKKQRFFALAMLWGILVYMIDSFFSFPMERILNFTFLLLIMAAVVSIYENSHHGARRDISKPGKSAVLITLLIAVGFSGILGYIRLRSEVHTRIAMEYRAQNDWDNVIKEIRLAESGLANLDPTSTPLAWYNGESHFMLKEYDLAFEDYLRALKYNPNHPHVLNNLGTCYELRKEHDKAIEYYKRALIANPDFDETLINLAAVYYNTGQYDLAVEAISKVAADCPDPRYPLFRQKIEEKLK